MSEIVPKVVFPDVFPQCADCPFAQRAADAALKHFPNTPRINLTCKLGMGGGIQQTEPGVFTEYRTREMRAVPSVISPGYQKEHLEGDTAACPVDIPNSPYEHANLPQMKYVVIDRFGRTWR